MMETQPEPKYLQQPKEGRFFEVRKSIAHVVCKILNIDFFPPYAKPYGYTK